MEQSVFTPVFDVLVADPIFSICSASELDFSPDLDVFKWWCDGFIVEHVVHMRILQFKRDLDAHALQMGKIPGLDFSFRRRGSSVEEPSRVTTAIEQQQLSNLFLTDTRDLYRVYDAAERFLCQPDLLGGQILLQLSPQAMQWMTEQYYKLDDAVVRELLGKKFNSKTRKDLDDVFEATRVLLKSCRRQYDNLRRIINMLEENLHHQHNRANIMVELQEKFELSQSLAARYTAIIFMIHHKFSLSCSRRPCKELTADDLIWSAAGLMCFWVAPTNRRVALFVEDIRVRAESLGALPDVASSQTALKKALEEGLSEVVGLDLDKDWVARMREIRSQLLSEQNSTLEVLHHKVMDSLKHHLTAQKMAVIDARLKPAVKSLLVIGANLGQSREFRNVFEELIIRIFELLMHEKDGLTLSEALYFIDCIDVHFPAAYSSYERGGSFTQEKAANVPDLWARYMGGVRGCLLFCGDKVSRN